MDFSAGFLPCVRIERNLRNLPVGVSSISVGFRLLFGRCSVTSFPSFVSVASFPVLLHFRWRFVIFKTDIFPVCQPGSSCLGRCYSAETVSIAFRQPEEPLRSLEIHQKWMDWPKYPQLLDDYPSGIFECPKNSLEISRNPTKSLEIHEKSIRNGWIGQKILNCWIRFHQGSLKIRRIH